MAHLLSDMTHKGEEFRVDLEDEVVRGALILNKGNITWPPPKPKQAAAPKPAPKKRGACCRSSKR